MFEDHFILLNSLRKWYEPKACYDCMHLGLQDFKFVSDYNLTLFKVSSRLTICGEKSLKIYTWKDIQYFSCLEGAPPPKILCQFTKYSKLLLVF